jgi:putative acetyltransferase
MGVIIRLIEKTDNPVIAELIRRVFREFKLSQTGTVYSDETTDSLFELFQNPNSQYWVAELDNIILGGCGFFPTNGLPAGCAEIVKFYLSPDARGKGTGKQLMQRVIDSARKLGYDKLYLETFPELAKTISIYEKTGFKHLKHPLGNSGHFACTIWMIKNLVIIDDGEMNERTTK